jgi:hypothetical protein
MRCPAQPKVCSAMTAPAGFHDLQLPTVDHHIHRGADQPGPRRIARRGVDGADAKNSTDRSITATVGLWTRVHFAAACELGAIGFQ